MHNIELDGIEIMTLIAVLEIAEYNTTQYWTTAMRFRGTEISQHDKEYLEQINALINKLKQKQGGR